jgi:prepilin peptidase CpaA
VLHGSLRHLNPETGVAGYPLLFVFPFAMAYAASSDLLTMRIANNVSLGLVGAFLVIALIAGMPPQEMLLHLAVGVALLIAGMVLFGLNLVGGGDAKLLAAGGLWIGYDQLVPFLLCVSIFGGALALLLLAYRRLPASALPLPAWAARLHTEGEGMPYGIAIAAGALAIYPITNWPALLGA